MKRFYVSLILTLGLFAPAAAQNYSQSAPSIACPAPAAATPVWGKLVITDNVVTCYYAAGVNKPTVWTQIGVPQTVGFLNNPLLVGMYINAHNGTGTATLSTGTVDNFSISPTPAHCLTDTDIGAPKLMGSANLIGTVWNLAGSGSTIFGTSDQFNFQPWLVWGNCTVICRVTSLSAGDTFQKIGIMVRDSLNSGSDYALFCAMYGGGVDFQYRLKFSNNADETLLIAPAAPGIVSSVVAGYGLTGSISYVVRP